MNEQKQKTNNVRHKHPSKLAIICIILAVVVPPIGILLAIIVLIKHKSVEDKSLGITGIIVGIVFGLLLINFYDMFFQFLPNSAETMAMPLTKNIEKMGGIKICDKGFNGNGIDYKEPYYRAYYRMTDNEYLTQSIKKQAGQMGFDIKPIEYPNVNNDEVNELQASQGKSEFLTSLPTLHDEETFAALFKDSLKVALIRKGPVDVACKNNEPTIPSTNEVIIELLFRRPHQ